MLAPSISGSVMTSWKGLRSWGSSDTNSSIPNCSYDTCSYIFLNTAGKPFPIMLGNYWGHDASILEGSVKGNACYRDEPVIWESALIRSCGFALIYHAQEEPHFPCFIKQWMRLKFVKVSDICISVFEIRFLSMKKVQKWRLSASFSTQMHTRTPKDLWFRLKRKS